MLVLEELEHAKARGAHIYGEMYGYGVSCDGGHITAPDKDGVGAAYAMPQAIKDARVNPERHRLHQRPRHQHAAGRSGRNDGHEERLQEHAKQVSISSTKSQLGHLLGASGGVELMLCLLAIATA